MSTTTFKEQDLSSSKPPCEIAVFAGGCFWCMEAVFETIDGITRDGIFSIEPGYTGGTKAVPTYQEVCSGQTGHAEAIRIRFNPTILSFQTLLSLFFSAHDPTTLNQQGGDIGTQYRSAIFYTSDTQKTLSLASIQELSETKAFQKPIVTEITALERFYPAEEYHHQFFQKNPHQGYCQMVIKPKIDRLKTKQPPPPPSCIKSK